MTDAWTKFEPGWVVPELSGPRLASLAARLAEVANNGGSTESETGINVVADEFFKSLSDPYHKEDALRLAAAGSILVDLALQGWPITLVGGAVQISRPQAVAGAVGEKHRVQAQEKIKRWEQLSAPSVRRFIAGMESSRLYGRQFVSIFSLMRDGEELSASLRHHRDNGSLSAEFANIVQPYIQVIASDREHCEMTGLLLSDIWRYFRHTWANQATSVPGRNMRFLVRDRSAPYHPIVGIGAIGSPIIALRNRDQIIGWDPEVFLQRVRSMDLGSLLAWVQDRISRTIEETYTKDLIEEGFTTKEDLAAPSLELIRSLRDKGREERRTHRNHVPDPILKVDVTPEDALRSEHWVEVARTHLYRSKRYLRLAAVLQAKHAFQVAERKGPLVDVSGLLGMPGIPQALSTLIRLEKGEKAGISMADIMVCGAVPPYNGLTGGKLVSALAVSPEIIQAYRQRYSGNASLIASGMAGRVILRNPELVLFGTTSLYGTTSSQYNRIKVPCEDLGGKVGESIQYMKVGHTETFGTSHFSRRTHKTLEDLVRLVQGSLPVNYIFGEGASPKLRNIREGLDVVGVSSDELLHHERRRIVYMIPVCRNYGDYLTGFASKPEAFLPMDDPSAVTKKIVTWWTNRWALQRVGRDSVLSEINGHTLTYPVEHGARVKMPPMPVLQGLLFE